MRDPDTCVIRDRSAQSFFSISATWSSGSKSNSGGCALGADDSVEALVRARPARRHRGCSGSRSSSAFSAASFSASWPSSSPALAPGFLGPGAKRGLVPPAGRS